MDFAAKLDQLITEAKEAGVSLEDINTELTCAADGIQGEIDDLGSED